jgi:hypothetical protein
MLRYFVASSELSASLPPLAPKVSRTKGSRQACKYSFPHDAEGHLHIFPDSRIRPVVVHFTLMPRK